MTDNYIERLHATNFRQFKTLDVVFNQNFNFIAGPNGCGKTSILAAISHCFSYRSLKHSRLKTETEIWTDIKISETKKRIGIGKNSIDDKGYRNQSITAWKSPNNEEGRDSISTHQANSKLKDFSPLFIGAQRNIKYKKINGMSREESPEQQLEKYNSISGDSLYGDNDSNIKQWFINRYFMIDKDWAKEEKENWNHMISLLPQIAPFNSNFSYVRTGRDFEPIFSIYGEECYIEELSAGFQAVLSIIANIFEWIESLKSGDDRLASKAKGTVLIDELDLHLHPEWQFSLRSGLKEFFPHIQFIVTTHSPHLLSSAEENEVIIMNRNYEQSEFFLKPSPKRYSGWSTDQILSEIMGVISLDNKVYEKLISVAFDNIEQKSIDGLKASIEEFSKVAHPNDSILTILRMKYASMVAIQND